MTCQCLCGALDCARCRGSAAQSLCPDCCGAISAEGYCVACGLDTTEIHPPRCRCDECVDQLTEDD